MKKTFIFLFFIFLLCVILSSCKKGEKFVMKCVDQDVILISYTNQEYDYSSIVKELERSDNMESFCEEMNISQYKVIDNMKYIVLNTGKGFYWVLFDENGQHATLRQVKVSPLDNLDKIEKLSIGMALEDVKDADPDGQFDFTYHSSNRYPKYSYHYFENGWCYYICYEDDTIDKIICFTL